MTEVGTCGMGIEVTAETAHLFAAARLLSWEPAECNQCHLMVGGFRFMSVCWALVGGRKTWLATAVAYCSCRSNLYAIQSLEKPGEQRCQK